MTTALPRPARGIPGPPPEPVDRRARRGSWLLPLFCLAAFAQTIAYYVYLRDDPGNYNSPGAFGDQVSYIALAQQLLDGSWAGLGHYMPGYPAVLALGQVLFGEPRLGAAIIQALVYAALVVGVWKLAAAAFGPGARAWAAGLVALNPAIGYYAGQALTEFLTGALLFAAVAALFCWSRRADWRLLALLGASCAGMAYLRAEYLAMAAIFAAVIWLTSPQGVTPGRRLACASLVIGLAVLLLAPWIARNAAVTGRPGLYNSSPLSNLILMGTWFRAFDEPTFAELQRIQQQPIPDDEAVERARRLWPESELPARYLAQLRGPYELPLSETLRLAIENIGLQPGRYLVNHFLLAPVLIWAGRTPLRQADVVRIPRLARWAAWAAQLALVALAVLGAVAAIREPRTRALALSALGVMAFLTIAHILVAVDERFTAPALPLVGLLAAPSVAHLVRRGGGAGSLATVQPGRGLGPPF